MAETMDTMRIAVEADTSGFERTLTDLSTRASRFGTAMTAALQGAVGGGKSLDGVLRQLGTRISTIALDAALKPLANLAGSAVGQVLAGVGTGSATSGASSGGVIPFAKGGVVRTPSYFPTGNGATGLMGEAGAEAIMPLKRGADGSLGVAVDSGSRRGGSSVVFNISTPDAASFRKSEGQIQAMLARAALRGQRGL